MADVTSHIETAKHSRCEEKRLAMQDPRIEDVAVRLTIIDERSTASAVTD